MATISVRIEDDIKDMAEEAAAAVGMSISEWTRDAVRTELGLKVGERRSAPASLTKLARQHLVMLHQIAMAVSDDDSMREYHEHQIEVLEHGFTYEYDDHFQMIYDELPIAECRLVWDLLEMFDRIKLSVEAIGIEAVMELDDNAKYALRFAGFDFNDRREGRLADYAEYVVLKKGRWNDLAEHFDDAHDRGNSHSPMLDSYQQMLAVFRPIWHEKVHGAQRGNYMLDAAELAQLSRAWPARG